LLLRCGPGLWLGCRTSLWLWCRPCLRLRCWARLRLRCRTGLWLWCRARLRLRCGAGFGTRSGVGLAGALRVGGLTGCWARRGRRALLVYRLAGPGRLDGGLAGALLIYGLAWALLSAGGRTGQVLARDLGLLLFAGHGWRCRRDGTRGGDGPDHGNFRRSAAIGGVELLLVLGRGLSYLTLLRERRGAVLATGS